MAVVANSLTSAVRSLLAPARAASKAPFRKKLIAASGGGGSVACWMKNMELPSENSLRTSAARSFASRTGCKPAEYSPKRPKTSHSTVIVEGNIGSGKAQLLNYFSTFPSVQVCEEPIELWRNKNGQNLLDLMYKDPKANSFAFQNYVLETMLDLHDQGMEKPVSMIERSFYSARYIFVENLKRNGLLTESEYHALEKQFQSYLTAETRNTKVDLILYIRTDPEIAHQRIMHRGRAEELSISVDYLRELHSRYEDWLCSGKFPIPAPIMVIDGNVSIKEVREQLRKRKDEILFGWSENPDLVDVDVSPRRETFSPKKFAAVA
ncbi:putative Deoxynucleoside kinase [Hypsibius exemplaris]|uniref:Deoxynucleoside kinase n=1 Tax=Hypsibius exemplaris TaxID=2072580 RepID=A0A1W0X816_HYPEX|nr:putative Deoxynucleoside kinase [Hypsibius exemplaris]